AAAVRHRSLAGVTPAIYPNLRNPTLLASLCTHRRNWCLGDVLWPRLTSPLHSGADHDSAAQCVPSAHSRGGFSTIGSRDSGHRGRRPTSRTLASSVLDKFLPDFWAGLFS